MAGDVFDAMRVYVLWAGSGDGEAGLKLAQNLGERLDAVGMMRDGVGFRIPVRLRNKPWRKAKAVPRPIDFDAADSNIVVIVYDDIMAARREWSDYLADIASATAGRGKKDIVIPVQASPNAYLQGALSTLQMIREPVADPDKCDWEAWLRRVVLNVLATILSHREASSGGRLTKMGVFLSHAKADGQHAALLMSRFRKLSPDDNITSLELFFDASDTISAAPFDQQFRDAIQHCAFLAIVTDAYHARRWCQWEILFAKAQQRPIVIWDLSQKGSLRAFPYLGNVPSVRGSGQTANDGGTDREVEELLLALLAEALRMAVWKDHARGVIERSGRLAFAATDLFARPPELTDIAYRAREVQLQRVIYPDPPLGHDERDLIEAAYPHLTLLALSEAS